jgi:hypothetical protein
MGRAFTSSQTVLQNAAGGTANGSSLDVAGLSSCVIQLSGTFVATVTFEGTVDGTNWIAMQFIPLSTGTAATTATTTGLYAANVAGLTQVRARVSAYTSGNITATGIASGAVR